MADSHTVRINVNTKAYERRVDQRMLLSDFIWHDLGLTGTHVACGVAPPSEMSLQ